MKRLLHCTLFLALTGLISTLLTGISPDTAHSAASDEDAKTDDTDIRFMRILSIKIQVKMDDQHGEFMGLRSGYYPYTKGEFDGIAKGKLLPQGGALSVVSDTCIEGKRLIHDDIRMTLLTDSGEKIYCQAQGYIRKEPDSQKHDYMHTSWTFRSSSEKYKWLNHTVGIANTTFYDQPATYRARHDIYVIKPGNTH